MDLLLELLLELLPELLLVLLLLLLLHAFYHVHIIMGREAPPLYLRNKYIQQQQLQQQL